MSKRIKACNVLLNCLVRSSASFLRTSSKIPNSFRHVAFWSLRLTSNSKRQITRKLNKWKFRKNTRALERQSFLRKGFLSSEESDGTTIGIKVTNTKLERWKRNTTKGTVGTDTGSYSCLTPGKKKKLTNPY
jgi:hypothetical protein